MLLKILISCWLVYLTLGEHMFNKVTCGPQNLTTHILTAQHKHKPTCLPCRPSLRTGTIKRRQNQMRSELTSGTKETASITTVTNSLILHQFCRSKPPIFFFFLPEIARNPLTTSPSPPHPTQSKPDLLPCGRHHT